MITTNKIMGRSKPSPLTNTTLYTVPALTQANVNLFCANQGPGEDYIRIAVTPSGVSLSATDYIIYDRLVPGNTTVNTTGVALNAGDFITIYSKNGTTSFVATGIEIASS